jgi:signal transduction histidine kinase
MYKRFRVQIVARLAGIVATALAVAYLVGPAEQYAAAVLVGLVLVYAVRGFIRYVESITRDLSRFLESVRYADFSRNFSSGGRGPLFDRLRDAFEEVTDAFREIRAEKEEQVRYLENVVQHLGIPLLSYRTDGTVEIMNTAARRLLRIGSIRNIEAMRTVSDVLVDTLESLDAGEQAMVSVSEDDRTMQLAVRVSRFRLRGEEHALASIQDLRNELEEKEMEAWQQLTRVLTHEIMNSVAPISSLASTARRLLEEVPSGDGAAEATETAEDVREAVQTIERRSEGLIGFVDSYRSFTKIPNPSYSVLSVQELFEDVRRLLGVSIREHDLDVQIQVEPPDLQVTADHELIEQVLINLVLNAIQALEGQDDARILLKAHIDRRSRPVLQIRDNGPGIPPDVQERIFVPFFTTKDDGSGIGLSLSRQIMRLHGGALTVRSTPGEETVFALRF